MTLVSVRIYGCHKKHNVQITKSGRRSNGSLVIIYDYLELPTEFFYLFIYLFLEEM